MDFRQQQERCLQGRGEADRAEDSHQHSDDGGGEGQPAARNGYIAVGQVFVRSKRLKRKRMRWGGRDGSARKDSAEEGEDGRMDAVKTASIQ